MEIAATAHLSERAISDCFSVTSEETWDGKHDSTNQSLEMQAVVLLRYISDAKTVMEVTWSIRNVSCVRVLVPAIRYHLSISTRCACHLIKGSSYGHLNIFWHPCKSNSANVITLLQLSLSIFQHRQRRHIYFHISVFFVCDLLILGFFALCGIRHILDHYASSLNLITMHLVWTWLEYSEIY